MAVDREALLQHYRGMRDQMLEAIDGLNDELMLERSIDGWSVVDHLAHIALWDEIRATEVVRISAGHDSVWRMSHQQDAAYNELGYALRSTMSPAQARWELTESRRKLLEAIASATPRGLDASLYGEAGLRSEHEGEHAGWIQRWRKERGV